MSQIIGYLTKNACYICVDSNIVFLNKSSIRGNKLFIGKNFLIATIGLTFGIDILEGLMEKSKILNINTFEEIEEYLMSIGSMQYRSFIYNFENKLKEDFLRIYFIYSAKKASGELGMGLLGAEGNEVFKKVDIKNTITAPRRLGIEMAMTKLVNIHLNDLINFFSESMKKISTVDSNVSPPFRLGIIDANGITHYKLLEEQKNY